MHHEADRVRDDFYEDTQNAKQAGKRRDDLETVLREEQVVDYGSD